MGICGLAYPRMSADGILIWNCKVGLQYFIQRSGTRDVTPQKGELGSFPQLNPPNIQALLR
jgi:hypothetical protein